MSHRKVGFVATTLFASSVLLSTTSCTTTATVAPSRASESGVQPRQRLVQLNFGREATFAVCAEPACPTVTTKTLASELMPTALRSLSPEPAATQQVALRQPAPSLPPPATPAMKDATADAADDLVESPTPIQGDGPREAQPETKQSLPHAFVSFPFGSALLTDGSKLALNRALPNARAAARIVISGRTDSVGDQKTNEALALARALAVREYLRDQLVDLPNIISIDAKGRCCFIASNETADGRAKNRRVEIAFLVKGGA